MKIAVDFDGTLVEDKFPDIGKDIPYAFEALKLFMQYGHLLVLWTSRKGKELEEAVNYCESKGIVFYAVNKNFLEEVESDGLSRKIVADCYIDDRNIFAKIDWKLIACRILNMEISYVENYL